MSSRQVYDLAVYFGDVGGTYGALLLISSFIASFFNEKLALVRKAQTFYKVSQDDPYFTGEKDEEKEPNFSRLSHRSTSLGRLSWFANLIPLRVSLRDKIALIFCCCGCLTSSK